jgi:hypothetical protein
MSVILYKNFDVNALSPCEVMKNKSGGNQVSLKYKDSRRIILQVPAMNAPFGLSEYVPASSADGGSVKYSIDFSFKGHEEDSKIASFMKVMQDLDEYMITLGVNHSESWFGKKMSSEVVRELYRPIVKASKQPEKYAPTIKMKIRTRPDTNAIVVDAYNHDRTEFDITAFQPGTNAKCIVDFAPIWFVNKQFGLTMTVLQLEVVSVPQNKLVGFAFQNDDDDDPEENLVNDDDL